MIETIRTRLTRSKLRDLTIFLSACSALFFDAGVPDIILSLVFLVIGSLVHIVAKGTLIRNEVLCKKGIYAIVRHPYYLANYLVDTAFCLLSGNKWLLLWYPFVFFWAYGPTFRQEERTLVEKHADAAVQQLLKTPGLYPDRHSFVNAKDLFGGFAFTRVSAKEVARVLRFFTLWLMMYVLRAFFWPDVPGLLADSHFWQHVILAAGCIAVLYVFSMLVLGWRKRT